MPLIDATTADLLLRGGVAGVLLVALGLLAWPGPGALARLALAGLAASQMGFLATQRPELLLALPAPVAWGLLLLSVGGAAWFWAAARALFDDRFGWQAATWGVLAASTALGLVAHGPVLSSGLPGGPHPGLFKLPDPGSALAGLALAHGAVLMACNLAALWVVVRDWRSDLVAPRRAARHGVATAVAAYAVLSFGTELALQAQAVPLGLKTAQVGLLGLISAGLVLWVARHGLDSLWARAPHLPPGPSAAPGAGSLPAVADGAAGIAELAGPLGAPGAAVSGPPTRGNSTPGEAPDAGAAPPTPSSLPGRAAASGLAASQLAPAHPNMASTDSPKARPAPAEARRQQGLARLQAAMDMQRLYRQEGLSLASLARQLSLSEPALRALIHHGLGHRNFNDFLHQHRLTEAAERLRSEDRPVLSIALDVGYGSIGPFNRAFKARFGCTPSAWREMPAAPSGRATPPS